MPTPATGEVEDVGTSPALIVGIVVVLVVGAGGGLFMLTRRRGRP
jgi:hypothetical protein